MAQQLVKNAADPRQRNYAERVQKERRERFLAALRETLHTVDGRIVIWELIARAGVYHSIWDPSARIHYNEGRRVTGLELLQDAIEADSGLYELMEREARARQRAQDRETAAMHTPRAEERTDD